MLENLISIAGEWHTAIWASACVLTVVGLNAFFVYRAMRTADNRMHLMLKILHQNLKYFRSFDARLNQIVAENRKSGSFQNKTLGHQNTQLSSIIRQIREIESMLSREKNSSHRRIANGANLLFPRIAEEATQLEKPRRFVRVNQYNGNRESRTSQDPQVSERSEFGKETLRSSEEVQAKAARLMAIFNNEDEHELNQAGDRQGFSGRDLKVG